MKNALYYLILIVSLTCACTYNNVYLNREEDNNEGKVLLKKFYSNVINENYRGVDEMVGSSIKILGGPHVVRKLVKFINSKVGKCKGYTIEDRYIRRTTGSINETSYNYKLKVTYDKGTINEVIGFIKRDGSESKINAYQANSDLLMN
ncbi:hypothetical protein [Pedobacter cryoconitis]|uniref:Lipoprotein n=1 Tax=Pedobacter cryoconitis TaxID=188932 RepID=A0A7X0J2P1_9SPHI|nr:hypothetical protein [Pedobacter cryoconitis]MBB6499357.1 hypothetical protein [Pedobacter cryoconitis]